MQHSKDYLLVTVLTLGFLLLTQTQVVTTTRIMRTAAAATAPPITGSDAVPAVPEWLQSVIRESL